MTDVIRDLPRDERPRERLLLHGADTLSDAELLAVVLGSGVSGQNAIQLARELLAGGMRSLHRRELASLARIRGVGPAKTARIAAVFEMCRRLTSEHPEEPAAFEAAVLGPKLVSDYGHHVQERLGAAFLDSRHRVKRQREIFVGTINTALVSTRDIVRFALLEAATAVVVYHNHPSGDPTPSAEDVAFTRKLQQSLAMVDVDLIDHIVVGSQRFYSMQERGQL